MIIEPTKLGNHSGIKMELPGSLFPGSSGERETPLFWRSAVIFVCHDEP